MSRLTEEELAALRFRAESQDMSTSRAIRDRRSLLAHLDAITEAVERLPLYDPDFRITTMGGEVREQRTMADAAESVRTRVLALLRDHP